ncbi:cytochrome-c peroxidase [Flavobacterium sp. JP2137]|uniref:cytochrome-c peroxidase n=1 Tax=Flavobacterium sp. JP2137 TaxID=3414510 RepID=UPI003D2FAC2A
MGFFLTSCATDEGAYQEINAPIAFEAPANFPDLTYRFTHNPLTEKGFELGRKLFYDGRLSSNGIVSCSFCHEQAFAFTHHGHDLSHGVDDLIGNRNTPAIQNLAFQSEYFYDGASSNLEMVAIVPIHNPVEMNESLPAILEKLQADKTYVRLFGAAFPDQAVSAGNMLKALAQFMTLMVSADSKYDRVVRSEGGAAFSASEGKGQQLFNQHCASCHATDLFTDHSFRNNGLPPNPRVDDWGRELVSGSPNDRYKFKVPSLRNVEVTAPYMHDGRFGSLQSVLDFYTHGVLLSENLDPLLMKNPVVGIALSPQDKADLIAFLKTLTDPKYMENPKFYEKT